MGPIENFENTYGPSAGATLILLGATIILHAMIARGQGRSTVPSQTVAALLARYPGPVVLHQPPGRLVVLALIWALSVAYGYWRTMTGVGNVVTVWWFPGIMSAFCAFVFLKGLPTLTLDADGFEMASRIRTVRLNWRSVTRIYGIPFKSLSGKNNFVRYDATPGQPWLMLGGFDISADELAELMTLWRAQALATEPAV